MKHSNRNAILASLFLVLALIGSVPAAAQELTSSEEAAIKTEAQRHVERYYNLYYERNPQALSTEIFTSPWILMGGNGVTVRTTEEENLEYFSTAIAGLLERGWDKSTFRTKNVCVLAAGSAILDRMVNIYPGKSTSRRSPGVYA